MWNRLKKKLVHKVVMLMSTQQLKLDIKQLKPESLNIFYGSLLQQIIYAKENTNIYQEYLESKKEGKVK